MVKRLRNFGYKLLNLLEEFKRDLPSCNFIRVDEYYMVAQNKVQSLDGYFSGIGSHRIPISRSRKEMVVDWVFYRIMDKLGYVMIQFSISPGYSPY